MSLVWPGNLIEDVVSYGGVKQVQREPILKRLNHVLGVVICIIGRITCWRFMLGGPDLRW